MPGDSCSEGYPRRFGLPAVRSMAALTVALLLISPGQALAIPPRQTIESESNASSGNWSVNLYDASGVRFQNPDWQACTAAATESMLNLIALASNDDMPPPRGGSLPRVSLRWHVDTSFETQEAVLAFERDNMTQIWSSPGTDVHGWRNALNFYGWGAMDAGFYVDAAYDSFDAAARATVHALARTNKPVGILGWFGGHAQFVTGYKVHGADPRISDDYTLLGVYLTDPLEADDMRNAYIDSDTWQYGPLYIRFSQYWQNESPYVDPIDGQVGYNEWRGRWVVVQPVK